MRHVLRWVFAALAVLALGTQAARLKAKDTGAGPDLDARLISLGLRPIAPPPSASAAAVAPGCAAPVSVTRARFDGLGMASVGELTSDQVVTRYVYLGFVGKRASLPAIIGRYAAAGLLGVVGLRPEAVSGDVVVVVLPRACPDLISLDWAVLSPWS